MVWFGVGVVGWGEIEWARWGWMLWVGWWWMWVGVGAGWGWEVVCYAELRSVVGVGVWGCGSMVRVCDGGCRGCGLCPVGGGTNVEESGGKSVAMGGVDMWLTETSGRCVCVGNKGNQNRETGWCLAASQRLVNSWRSWSLCDVLRAWESDSMAVHEWGHRRTMVGCERAM